MRKSTLKQAECSNRSLSDMQHLTEHIITPYCGSREYDLRCCSSLFLGALILHTYSHTLMVMPSGAIWDSSSSARKCRHVGCRGAGESNHHHSISRLPPEPQTPPDVNIHELSSHYVLLSMDQSIFITPIVTLMHIKLIIYSFAINDLPSISSN